MKIHAEKTQAYNKQSSTTELIQKQSGDGATFQLVDNRAEAITQRKLKSMVRDSFQLKQLELSQDKNNHPVQLREKYTIKQSVTPSIYSFTEEAIGNGAPTRLTYFLNKNSESYVQDAAGKLYSRSSISKDDGREYFPVLKHTVNRIQALTRGSQLAGESRSWVAGLSRDEYPYASTMDGGQDSFWAYVPAAEQNSQGGQLSSLYRRVIESGDPEFDVELD